MAPYSDLDLVLLHNGKVRGLTDIADALWYPIWDSGVALDHSVRTVDEAVSVADEDIKAVAGMLDLRHVAGDETLTAELREKVLIRWRASAPERVEEMHAASDARLALFGEGAYLLEPNLKESRGGSRDAQALHALAMAQLVDMPPAVRRAYADLLDVRGELHRITGGAVDVLRLQEQDGVALCLDRLDADGRPDRDSILLQVNSAARLIAHTLDAAWRRVRSPVPSRRVLGGGQQASRRLLGRGQPSPSASSVQRVGLARDVVAHDGEVVLALDAKPPHDGGIVLRAARAAAENAMPIAPATLARLRDEAAALPQPWPEEARDDFVALLGSGSAAVSVLESLDLADLLEPLIPEWAMVRSKAQHNPVHTFTVDRHLLECAAVASRLVRGIDRPDLLLVGALLHDIGKGLPGDHSVTGAPVAAQIATRMGFAEQDVAVIRALTRHHLLLPDTATRRDPDDPATLRIVLDAVGDDPTMLELLHALSIADAAATGPAAWSDWKASLIAELVRRVRVVQRGAKPPTDHPLDERRRALAEDGKVAVLVGKDDLTVAVPDRIGALYRTAGVLALDLLDVRTASIRTYQGMAVNHFVVAPRFGRMPDPARLREELIRVLDGDTGLAERLREKERTYARPAPAEIPPPTVHWFDDEATDATVLEYRARDSLGLLCRVTAALERAQLDVRGARVESVAGSVVDAFYVTTRSGGLVPASARPEIAAELLRA
jgi:[protein-PII] uridylyltransferase